MPEEASNLNKLLERTRAQLAMLVVVFLFGMGVGLIGDAEGALAEIAKNALLVLHVLVGVGLVVGAIRATRVASKLPSILARLAQIGGAAIGLAFVGGILMVVQSEAWSYLMVGMFVLALAFYVVLYAKARAAGT